MLKRIAENDFRVSVAERVAGRILAGHGPGMVTVWTWTITGPYVPESLQPSNGRESSLDAAKAAFREKFDRWLEWAVELGHPVIWHG